MVHKALLGIVEEKKSSPCYESNHESLVVKYTGQPLRTVQCDEREINRV
jgi:hypothetical protein